MDGDNVGIDVGVWFLRVTKLVKEKKMRRLIVAVVATGALCALSANAQKLSTEAVSPDEKTSNGSWVFGSTCDFDAVNGSIDRIVGFLNAGAIAWLQHFEVDESCDCITGLDIQMYRTANNPTDMWEGREVTAYLWNDESPDYDPGDSTQSMAPLTAS